MKGAYTAAAIAVAEKLEDAFLEVIVLIGALEKIIDGTNEEFR